MPGQCKYSYVSFLGISDPEVLSITYMQYEEINLSYIHFEHDYSLYLQETLLTAIKKWIIVKSI